MSAEFTGSAEYVGQEWCKGCHDYGQCGKPSQFAEESDFIDFQFLVWLQGHDWILPIDKT
jgi:hypothetical protein